MIYLALLRNQWRSFIRSFQGKRLWLVGLGLVPVVLYLVLVLVVLGLFFDKIIRVPRGSMGAVSVLNSQLLTLFFGMLVLRFFFQRPPRMEIHAYLHLPIERRHLVRYFQGASLLSLHNLYPWFFIIPFWVRYVAGRLDLGSAMMWLSGMFLLVLLSHYLNTLLRILVDRYAKVFLMLAVSLIAFQLVDQALGARFVHHLSSSFFNPLALGNLRPLLALALITPAAFLFSSRALLDSLRSEHGMTSQRPQRALPSALTFSLSPIRNLVVLELMMMWRNKRTKQYVLISVGVSTAYTALLLSDYSAIFANVMAAAVGLFASGVFALNYGQLMFAWESRYFDGLLARDIQLQHAVLAKFMVLMGSCLALFIISLPLFFWLAPNLLMLHVAFLFYNAGVTSMLMLALSVFNRRRVNAAEGSFFNYQGFSIMHWLWIIPTILPPALLLYFMEANPDAALSLIASMGLICMLLAWPWSMLLARFLGRRKYLMAEGFRNYER